MADNVLNSLKIGANNFRVKSCWEQLGLTQNYMLALLSRDEYTPHLDDKPTSSTLTYIDPQSGGLAVFHEGQCVIYPISGSNDEWGLSIAKMVVCGAQGDPLQVIWHHCTSVEETTDDEIADVSDLIFYNTVHAGEGPEQKV